MVYKISTTLIFLIILQLSHAQQGRFDMDQLSDSKKQVLAPFCIPNNEVSKEFVREHSIQIKYETTNWMFITCTAELIENSYANKAITDYYLDNSPPVLMNDSSRTTHNVNQVHNGVGLDAAYQGEGVIIGYVDTGLDWSHPDFYDENGNTRVIRYWDQSTNSGAPISPYGYGIVWDSTAINNGTCTSTDNHSHGSTVAGAGSGNGLSVGYNHGMAPKSSVVIVESNFSLPNWTMTVVDACDYIFKVADSLNMPAVVNLSLGTYLGSHDGNDAASEAIESFLDEKDGRIVVSACGNSGNQGKYHCHGDVTADTSMVWFYNNTNGSYGANTVFFDLWSDMTDATFDYSFQALNPSNNYDKRGETIFRPATLGVNSLIRDTIWNGINRIATIEIYLSQVGDNYRMQGFISRVDSTSYVYGLYTTGSGQYDLWSGNKPALGFRFNDMVENTPDAATYPDIIYYNHPDSLQTIVSSWNCSEKVISVGNIHNRFGFANNNGGYYTNADLITPGKLSINSSKGPNRHNEIKPDIVANGDVSLTTGPLWYLTNPGNWNTVDSGGWHMANGGTSMACPVISGIAALYLERCTRGNYQSFKDDLIGTAMSNQFTSTLPDNAYGYGVANAHGMLLANQFDANLVADTALCGEPNLVTINSSEVISIAEWSTGDEAIQILMSQTGQLYSIAFNQHGCGTPTDTLEFVQLEVPTIDPIVNQGNDVLSTTSSTNYQWTLNGSDLTGETNSTLSISEPYGTYTCYAVSTDGCITETDPFSIFVGIEELESIKMYVYPNPTVDKIQFVEGIIPDNVNLFSTDGKEVSLVKINQTNYSIKHLPSGRYLLKTIVKGKVFETILVRQ